MCPVTEVLPVIGYFVSSHYRRSLEVQRRQYSLLINPEYVHPQFTWGSNGCSSRQCGICLKHLRYRVPNQDLYLFCKRLLPSDLSHFCGERELLDHFLLSCRRYTKKHHRYLLPALNRLGLHMTTAAILPLGADTLNSLQRCIQDGLCRFIVESGHL